MTVSESDNDAAWALRKAFDDVLAGNSGMPRVYSMTSNPVHHHKQTQKPHHAKAGLPNSHFLQQPHHHSMHQQGQHAPSVPFVPQQVHCLCMCVPRHPSSCCETTNLTCETSHSLLEMGRSIHHIPSNPRCFREERQERRRRNPFHISCNQR
jgi:hypothetical protein